jgi:methyl-accepting chemotaxis protein
MNNFNQNDNNQKTLLSKFKLRTQLVFGYAIPVVVFIGSTTIVYSNANKVFEAFSKVETVQKSIIEVDKIAVAGSNMVANNRAFLLSERQDFVRLYNESWQNFQEASNNLEKVITDPKQKERFDTMKRIGKEYDQYVNQIFNLIKSGKKAEAIALFNTGVGSKALADFLELNSQFNTAEIDRLSKENLAARNTLQGAVNLLILGSFFSAVTAFIIAWLISSLVSGKISQAVISIDNSSREINIAVGQQEKITNSQAISVNETTTAMDQLGSSAQQATQQAETSNIGAQQVLNLAQTGNELVEITLKEMAQTKDKVQAISQQILRLSEQTNQIGSISQLVSDLANQTNMLALNAAVEAVRAGEYGKGFSVVASEIRKLADESKKSADRINNLVVEIKQATNVTVVVTEAGIKTVENTEDLTKKTASAFGNMTEQINNIVINSQQISMNSKQQVLAIQQVVTAMNNLNQNSKDSTDGMNQIKTGIQKLNHAALELNAIVKEGEK